MFDSDFSDLISKEAIEFYERFAHEPIDKLLFKYANNALKKEWIIQLDARRRAKAKLPSWYNNSGIVFPPKANLEQASSEVTAAYKANLVPFASSIDLTGGTAVDTWKLALKANKHVYVEPNSGLLELAKHNLKALNLDNVNFENQTAEDYIFNLKSGVDLIYLDPSRRSQGKKVFRLEQYTPDISVLLEPMLKHAKHVLIKVSPLVDLSQLISVFSPSLLSIHVVAVKNECKEVLVILSENAGYNPTVHAVNLTSNNEAFVFKKDEEKDSYIEANQIENYIYEPNAAALKAGAFNSLSTRYNIGKLHVSSHLYTSNEILDSFPGKVFKVLEVSAPFKLSKRYEPVSIATRNFPLSVAAIRKKLKWTDGDSFKLFATTFGDKKCFIVCSEAL